MDPQVRNNIIASFLDLAVPFNVQVINKDSTNSTQEWKGHKLHELIGWGASNKHIGSLVCTIESFSRGYGGYFKTAESKPEQPWSVNLAGGIAEHNLTFEQFEAHWELLNPEELKSAIEDIKNKSTLRRERPLKMAIESGLKDLFPPRII